MTNFCRTVIHKDCGGRIIESRTTFNFHRTESGKLAMHPALFCEKCSQEIPGDEEIEMLDENHNSWCREWDCHYCQHYDEVIATCSVRKNFRVCLQYERRSNGV